jgi:hypothetical protein
LRNANRSISQFATAGTRITRSLNLPSARFLENYAYGEWIGQRGAFVSDRLPAAFSCSVRPDRQIAHRPLNRDAK